MDKLAFWALTVLASLNFYSNGEKFASFIQRQRLPIQEQIMIGSEGALRDCDLLNLIPQTSYLSDEIPQWNIELEFAMAFDLKTLASTSSCLLLSFHVNNFETLTPLIEFGWAVTQHMRLGMVLSLGPGMTLQFLPPHTPNLPFLIAAKSDYGFEEFLCPVVGQHNPVVQSHMCDRSYSSYVGKTLNLGHTGIWPYVYEVPVDGRVWGVDVALMNLLRDKMKFKIDWNYFFKNPTEMLEKVRKYEFEV